MTRENIEWTKPYYGVTHYVPEWRAKRWATICTRNPQLHILTRWDKDAENYFAGPEHQEVFKSLLKAKLAGAGWSLGAVSITQTDKTCPTCHRTL